MVGCGYASLWQKRKKNSHHMCTVVYMRASGRRKNAWLISHPPIVLSQNKSATSNQPAVLFFQNKPAPVISHQPLAKRTG
jgi:hypothetical protein